MKWAYTALALVALAAWPGCDGGIPFPPWPSPTPTPAPTPTPTPTPSPDPTPTPTPTPDPHEPKCNRPPAELKCDCWNRPPGGEWSWKECSGPTPPPTQKTPCTKEEELIATPGGNPIYHQEVKMATDKLGPQGNTPKANLALLAKELRKQVGHCVISGKEAVFIIRPDGRWEENHAVSFGDGSWTNSGRGKFMGNHDNGSPVPVGLLPDPTEWDDYAEYSLKKWNGKWDRTLQLKRVLAYCEAIGMGDIEGVPRASCPVRPEGHPDRTWWEREVYGAYWECDGKPINPSNNNPAQAVCLGHVKTCDRARQICSEADW